MTKDFDDFAGLTDDEVEVVMREACNAADIEIDEDGSFKTNPMFAMVFSARYSQALLRAYHEWANG